MPQSVLAQEPEVEIERSGDRVTAKLAGYWTAEHAAAIERIADEIVAEPDAASHHPRSCRGAQRLDTLGAWVLDRTRHELGKRELSADFANADPDQQILLDEVAYRGFQETKPVKHSRFVDFLVDVGRSRVRGGPRPRAAASRSSAS